MPAHQIFKFFFSKRFLVWSFGFYNFFLRDFWFPEDWQRRNLAAKQISQLVILRLPFCIFSAKIVKITKFTFFYLNLIFACLQFGVNCSSISLTIWIFSFFINSYWDSRKNFNEAKNQENDTFIVRNKASNIILYPK